MSFQNGTPTDDIGTALDEYFAGQATQSGEAVHHHDNNTLSSAQMANLDIPTDEIVAYHDKEKPPGSSQGQEPFTEAARGLVNIPFDVLQGGANLIDALSQAGGRWGLIIRRYLSSRRQAYRPLRLVRGDSGRITLSQDLAEQEK
ncbi:hypothetical protein ARAF_0694 [Arsenophonus endosymbiont of Aleurodicus floccissimus]|nr:hypothetical protein ARAF_0694 [Arsenophonus endosymbiont of Aleurodicus floccissimus]